jgi:tetratricopeptide (TPR) repeat protein
MQGHFAEAERFAEQAFAIGRQLHAERATGMLGLQMFSLRREQGRLRELEPLVKYFLAQHKEAGAWRPGLAVIYAELGRREEAQDQFEHLARFDFADIPRDSMWMVTMTYLADVCTFLHDEARAATLYEMLLPYEHLNVVIGGNTVCCGAVSRHSAALAATLERWDDAQSHFDHALRGSGSIRAEMYGSGFHAMSSPGLGIAKLAAAVAVDCRDTRCQVSLNSIQRSDIYSSPALCRSARKPSICAGSAFRCRLTAGKTISAVSCESSLRASAASTRACISWPSSI